MNEDMNFPSVEASLAAPQNQPAQDASSLAPATGAAEPALSAPGDASTPAPPVQGGEGSSPLASPAYRNALDIMRKAANAARSGFRTGDLGAVREAPGGALQRLVTSLRGSSAAPEANPAAVTPPVSQPSNAPAPQIRMFSPPGGGRAYPTYEYGGNTILLGDDVDVNDQAAVQKRITETNNIIDMMNSAYEEV